MPDPTRPRERVTVARILRRLVIIAIGAPTMLR